MESEHNFSAWEQRTQQPKAQKPPSDVAADMDVDDVGLELQQQAKDLKDSSWIVDTVTFRLPMSSEIDHLAADLRQEQEISDRDNICLNAAMRGRIRAQQEHSELM